MQSISFTPTVDDLLAAYRLNLRSSLRSKRVRRIYLWGVIVVALGSAAAAGIWEIAPVWIAALAGGAYWIVVISLCIGVSFLRQRTQAKHILAQQRDLQGETMVEWSDEGISFRSERASSRFAWADFSAIVKGREMILLRQSDALMNFIPTRVLSDAQIRSIPEPRG